MSYSRAQRRQLQRDNAKQPVELRLVPPHEWPQLPHPPQRVWRSRKYLVQEYPAPAPALVRLSINKAALDGVEWSDGITWEALQTIKASCGYGDHDAVEVFPSDADVVNVANMRHLWVLREPLPFAWRAQR